MTRVENAPDDELVERFRRERADETFAEIYRRQKPGVYGRCLRMLRNTADAEDLTQHIFLTAFRKFDLFRGGDFEAWLLTIARHCCLNYLRARVPRQAEAGIDVADLAARPEASDPLVAEAVRRSLGLLSAPQRMSLKLFYGDGYTYREIAAILGCPESDVKSHIQNGRKRFQVAWAKGMNRAGEPA